MALHLVLIFGGMVVCAIFAVGSFTLADHFSNLFKCLKDLKSLLYLSLCVLFAMLTFALGLACYVMFYKFFIILLTMSC